MVDPLLDLVTDGLRGKVAWDLFAGVGLFARRLADRFDQVIAVESATGARAALTQNLAGTGATAVTGATEDFLRGAGKRALPDLIVVDPPRVGLGAESNRAAGADGRADADLCFVRSRDSGTRLAGIDCSGLHDRENRAGGSVPADIPSRNRGCITQVMVRGARRRAFRAHS